MPRVAKKLKICAMQALVFSHQICHPDLMPAAMLALTPNDGSWALKTAIFSSIISESLLLRDI